MQAMLDRIEVNDVLNAMQLADRLGSSPVLAPGSCFLRPDRED